MKRWMRSLQPWLCVGALLLLSACAFGDRKVTLSYQPETAESDATAAKVTTAATGAPVADDGKLAFIVVPFKDERADKNIVGEVRNGWGMHTADVVVQNDVAQWITDGLKTELAKAGYRVVESAADDSTAAQIEGTVARVYCTALFSYEAEVSFFATLHRDGKEVINQQYHGTGSAGVNMAATSGSYKDSLNRALAAALRSLIADLKIAGTTT
jgi:uncharacterized lipoprotein YmbA